jgi:hypothetical protein
MGIDILAHAIIFVQIFCPEMLYAEITWFRDV